MGKMDFERSINMLDWVFILKGAGLTIFLSAVSMICGSIIGLVAGVMRSSNSPWIYAPAWAYIYISSEVRRC